MSKYPEIKMRYICAIIAIKTQLNMILFCEIKPQFVPLYFSLCGHHSKINKKANKLRCSCFKSKFHVKPSSLSLNECLNSETGLKVVS